MVEEFKKFDIDNLYYHLVEKKSEDIKKSYTSFLINNPDVLVKKIGEESVETIIEILNKDKSKIINESADFIYHLVAAWVYSGVNPNEVWTELWKRNNFSKKRETNDL